MHIKTTNQKIDFTVIQQIYKSRSTAVRGPKRFNLYKTAYQDHKRLSKKYIQDKCKYKTVLLIHGNTMSNENHLTLSSYALVFDQKGSTQQHFVVKKKSAMPPIHYTTFHIYGAMRCITDNQVSWSLMSSEMMANCCSRRTGGQQTAQQADENTWQKQGIELAPTCKRSA